MPRRPKFTREQVLQSAYEVASRSGIECVTAQAVADNMGYTGSSLFTHFDSMQEIRHEVYERAEQKMTEYLLHCLEYKPAFKAFGMMWIQFAKDEPNLYRMLYSHSNFSDDQNASRRFEEAFRPIIGEVMAYFGISEESAQQLVNQCVIYVNGISWFIITGYDKEFTEERIGQQLSDICLGIVTLYRLREGTFTPELAEKVTKAINVMPKPLSDE